MIKITDGRTEEGKKEIELKKQFGKLLNYIVLDSCCDRRVPGQFIKKYKDRLCPNLKNLKSDDIKNIRLNFK